jgi:hypothetical protein
MVSAPRSLPAKSMKLIFPNNFWSCTFFSWNYRMACEREESALAPVTPLVLLCSPLLITCMICSTLSTLNSDNPTMFTFCLWSSLQCTNSLLFNKS